MYAYDDLAKKLRNLGYSYTYKEELNCAEYGGKTHHVGATLEWESRATYLTRFQRHAPLTVASGAS
jgi:hypothetical protein